MKSIRIAASMTVFITIASAGYSQLGLGFQSRTSAALDLRTQRVENLRANTTSDVQNTTSATVRRTRKAKQRSAEAVSNTASYSSAKAEAATSNAEIAADVHSSSNVAANTEPVDVRAASRASGQVSAK